MYVRACPYRAQNNNSSPAVDGGCEDVAAHEVTPGRGREADRQRVPGHGLGAVELGPGLGVGVVAEAEAGAGADGGRVGVWGRERGREQEVTGRRGLWRAPRAVLETRGRGRHVLSTTGHP